MLRKAQLGFPQPLVGYAADWSAINPSKAPQPSSLISVKHAILFNLILLIAPQVEGS
jgi:hypothetical protein